MVFSQRQMKYQIRYESLKDSWSEAKYFAFTARSKHKNINFCDLSEGNESISIGKIRHRGKLLIRFFLKH